MLGWRAKSGVALTSFFLGTASSFAQVAVPDNAPPPSAPASEADGPGEEIVVTGTRIRGIDAPSSSPLDTIDADELVRTGAVTSADLVRNLAINTGSQFNSDVQAQGGTLGTAQFNLRGLGLNSTLVLLNGRRQTEFAVPNADNDSFVDVNSLVPLIALDRIEILKDGATALYGSDAVAGVVNYVTRRRFDGAEVQAGAQTTDGGDQTDLTLAGVIGRTGDNYGVMIAASYLDRTALDAGDRPQITSGSNVSTLGQPGSFQPVFFPIGAGGRPNLAAPPQAAGPPVRDPLCGQPGIGGVPGRGVGADGGCGFDSSFENSLVPDEKRFVGFASASVDLGDALSANIELAYADAEASAETSTSFPIVQFPIVAANNPGNTFRYTRPFGPPGSGQFTGDRAATRFFGRAFGINGEPQFVTSKNDLYRIAGGVDYAITSNLNLDVDLAYSRSHATVRTPDLLADQFQLALNGQAGPGRNLFFNPFGNAATARPGDPRFNSPEVLAAIRTVRVTESRRELKTAEAVLSGSLFTLPGGQAGFAIGAQYRDDKFSSVLDDQANANNLLFLFGDQDVRGSQDTRAAFAELRLPILESVDVQLAARYEKYSNFSSFDPKVGVVFRPFGTLLLRGSYGTAFRAPSVVQAFGSRTGVLSLDDPVTNSLRIFRPVRTIGNPDLRPEQAEVFSAGVEFEPVRRLRLELDYYRFDYSDRIVRRNAQSLINANPRDARIIRSPVTNDIQRVEVEFFNAASLVAEGIDASASYRFDAGAAGSFSLRAAGSFLLSYDIQESDTGPTIDGVGSRNFLNIGTSAPEVRVNGAIDWDRGPLSASIRANYIDAYRDDRAGGGRIGSHTTIDVQAGFLAGGEGAGRDLRFSLGVINLFDNLPPRAVSEIGYDPTVHDPRGRIFYARTQLSF